MAPGFATFKKGSIQLQRATKVVNEQIGSRQMLSVFVITGFVLCGVVEQSASVALRANSTSSYSAAEFAEYVENTSYITRYCQPPSNKTIIHVVRSIPHIEIPMTRTDETEAVLRQAFMWGSLVSPLGASRVAARVGAERLFGAGVLGTGVVAIMVPAAWLTPSHVAIRIIQGIFVGATFPAAHMLAVTWIKPKHVSGFVSLYTAVNLGYAIVGILGTLLVRSFGRDWLSYVIALCSFLWYFLWWRFVEESLHPNRPKRDEHKHLPWRRLLTSKPAWACGIAVIGSQWADATLMLGVTKYLKLVYGFSIEYVTTHL
jgi:ACS family sodium-dependent inorganic phosphate cotransporter